MELAGGGGLGEDVAQVEAVGKKGEVLGGAG